MASHSSRETITSTEPDAPRLASSSIAAAFRAKAFPQEIRDLVYYYIVVPQGSDVEPLTPPWDTPGAENDPILSLLHPARVGEDTSKELLRRYWSENTFLFTGSASFYYKAFCEDYFGLGIRGMDYLRHAIICLCFDEDGSESAGECRAMLMYLLEVKHELRWKVEFRLETEFDYPPSKEGMMCQILEILRPIVYELIHGRGCNVTIFQLDFEEATPSNIVRTRYLTAPHPTNLFNLTAEEWAQEKANEDVWDLNKHLKTIVWTGTIGDAMERRWGVRTLFDGFEVQDDGIERTPGGGFGLYD